MCELLNNQLKNEKPSRITPPNKIAKTQECPLFHGILSNLASKSVFIVSPLSTISKQSLITYKYPNNYKYNFIDKVPISIAVYNF